MKFRNALVSAVMLGLPLAGMARTQEAVDASIQEEPAFLGVYLDEAATATDGVTISGVVEGSAAAKAGLKAGDRIVAIGDHAVGTADDLRKVLAGFTAGRKVAITYVRGDEKHQARTTLGARGAEGEALEEVIEVAPPGLPRIAVKPVAPPPVIEVVPVDPAQVAEPEARVRTRVRRLLEERAAQRGVVVQEEEEEEAEEGRGFLGVSVGEADEGVAVLSVVAGSPADRAGLKAGDLIRAIDGDEMDSVEQLVATISGKEAGTVIRIQASRGDDLLRMRARLGAREEEEEEGQELEEFEEHEEPLMPLRTGEWPVRQLRAAEARESAQAMDELRAVIQELKAENMHLREALEEARQGRMAPDQRGMPREMGPQMREMGQQMGQQMRAMGEQMRAMGQQVRELGEVVRRQGQQIEELQRRGERRRDPPEAGAAGVSGWRRLSVDEAPEVEVRDGVLRVEVQARKKDGER